jgi:hypothetical protein
MKLTVCVIRDQVRVTRMSYCQNPSADSRDKGGKVHCFPRKVSSFLDRFQQNLEVYNEAIGRYLMFRLNSSNGSWDIGQKVVRSPVKCPQLPTAINETHALRRSKDRRPLIRFNEISSTGSQGRGRHMNCKVPSFIDRFQQNLEYASECKQRSGFEDWWKSLKWELRYCEKVLRSSFKMLLFTEQSKSNLY